MSTEPCDMERIFASDLQRFFDIELQLFECDRSWWFADMASVLKCASLSKEAVVRYPPSDFSCTFTVIARYASLATRHDTTVRSSGRLLSWRRVGNLGALSTVATATRPECILDGSCNWNCILLFKNTSIRYCLLFGLLLFFPLQNPCSRSSIFISDRTFRLSVLPGERCLSVHTSLSLCVCILKFIRITRCFHCNLSSHWNGIGSRRATMPNRFSFSLMFSHW